jgi:hypothetical protein
MGLDDQQQPPPARTRVTIVGGGPCGLMLANELGRRGIGAVVVDEKAGTAVNPQANATQARTMEHYRRLGFADEVRALGLPPDYPTDIAYFTRFAGHELARFALPSARQAKARVAGLGGSWSAAELPHRISQKFVEPVLRRHIEELFEDGVLDGRHGVRFQPKAERTIKCSAGMLNSWIPPADARVIYDIGVERSHITTLNFSAIYPKLESVCDRLYAAVGITPDRTVPGLLLPVITTATLANMSTTMAANETLPANPEILSLPQPVAPEILEPAMTEEKETVAASTSS